jgi:hypothetical protein
MLKTFYELFGFFGALSISLALFFFFIFWLAGLAGITLPVDGGKPKFNKWQVMVSIFIPLYPIYWLIRNITEQHRFMRKN